MAIYHPIYTPPRVLKRGAGAEKPDGLTDLNKSDNVASEGLRAVSSLTARTALTHPRHYPSLCYRTHQPSTSAACPRT
jgi:hypothetical protein